MDAFPSYVRAAYGLDRSWVAEALCTTMGGDLRRAWVVSPEQRITLGDKTIRGENLIAAALGVCVGCPAQWACATYAVRSMADAGTWGMHIDDLRWLRRQPDAIPMIEVCEEVHEPVQSGIKNLRSIRSAA
jgi:hypothetical protein